MAPTPDILKAVKADVVDLLKESKANAITIRLAWHDSGTYNKENPEWPDCGGANGSIRHEAECDHAANAGLIGAVNLLRPIKEKHPDISWADLFQMTSAAAVEVAGGPVIPMRYGRMDAPGPAADGRLPAAAAPFPDGSLTPAEHLRKVFYRMGFNDQEIVALSGAHTLGRAFKHRSGFGKDSTPYTVDGPGKTKGGMSWTVEWLKFDNSYFKDIKAQKDENLLVLPTDAALFEDADFKPFAEKYAEEEKAFFEEYAAAHAKLSELGSKWDGEPVPFTG